jgi:hypothetical protein
MKTEHKYMAGRAATRRHKRRVKRWSTAAVNSGSTTSDGKVTNYKLVQNEE